MNSFTMTLVIVLSLFVAAMYICGLFAQLTEIYFDAKEKYTTRMIGNLGKALSDVGRQMGEKEKD